MLWRNCFSVASRWSTSTSADSLSGSSSPVSSKKPMKFSGFLKHLVEFVGIDHHLGRMQLEIDLVEVTAPPAGQVAVDIGPLVVDRSLPVVARASIADDSEPLGEPLFSSSRATS